MQQFEYIIRDPHGIHARPAGDLVKVAKEYPCEIKIEKGETKADAKRILAVMGLAAKEGDVIKMTFDGEREDVAKEQMLQFFNRNL